MRKHSEMNGLVGKSYIAATNAVHSIDLIHCRIPVVPVRLPMRSSIDLRSANRFKIVPSGAPMGLIPFSSASRSFKSLEVICFSDVRLQL